MNGNIVKVRALSIWIFLRYWGLISHMVWYGSLYSLIYFSGITPDTRVEQLETAAEVIQKS